MLAVVALVLGLTLTGSGTGGGGGTAGEAVQGYLEALSRGDAEAALSFSDSQPASKELLTDEVLASQIEQWPISNIRILDDVAIGTMSRVHVSVNFGDKVSDATVTVNRRNNRWRLEQSTARIEPSPITGRGAAAETLTYFGKSVGDTTVYVFPGWLDVASTNPYLDVTAEPVLLDGLSTYGMGWSSTEFTLNDAGMKAVTDSVSDAYDACRRSRQFAPPPPCPESLGPISSLLVEGTVDWGQADISDIKVALFNPLDMTALVSGSATIPIVAGQRGGGTYTDQLLSFVSGDADMAQSPPTLEWR